MKNFIYLFLGVTLLASLLLGCTAPSVAPSPSPAPSSAPSVAPSSAPSVAPSSAPASPSTPVAKTKEVVLTAITLAPHDDSPNTGYLIFEKLVNERGKGKVTIKWVGGPEAVGVYEQPEAVRTGLVDMANTGLAFTETMFPPAAALVISDYDTDQQRQVGVYEYLKNGLMKSGIYFSGRSGGMIQKYFYTKKKIETIGDFKGMPFRGEGPLYSGFFQGLGLKEVFMPIGDVYTALERGLIDGYGAPITDVVRVGTPEIVKKGLLEPYFRDAMSVVMNLNKWNTLPKDIQDILTQAAIDTEKQIVDVYTKLQASEISRCESKGMVFNKFTSPDDSKRLAEIWKESVWTYFKSKYPQYYDDVYRIFTKKS